MRRAARFRYGLRMKIGVIGGSGLYAMEGIQRKRWVSVPTPFGKPSDQFLIGRLGKREVVFLPRHGRGHTILPSELNHRANIYGMKKLGVSTIISVSAVGSLKQRYQPTDIVLIDQFFDRTKRSKEFTFFGAGIVAHISFADPVRTTAAGFGWLRSRGRRDGARWRYLCEHGRPVVLDARRVTVPSEDGLGRSRDDQPRRGALRAGSGDLLRDARNGDRL